MLSNCLSIQALCNINRKRRIVFGIALYLCWGKMQKLFFFVFYFVLFCCVLSIPVCNSIEYNGKKLNNFKLLRPPVLAIGLFAFCRCALLQYDVQRYLFAVYHVNPSEHYAALFSCFDWPLPQLLCVGFKFAVSRTLCMLAFGMGGSIFLFERIIEQSAANTSCIIVWMMCQGGLIY